MIELLMDTEIPEDMRAKLLRERLLNRMIRNWLDDDSYWEALKLLRDLQ